MPKFYSEIQEASLENLSSDPSGNVAGKIWRNTTEDRVKTDDGTTKRALLRNDQKCVVGNHATANNNIRLHRGASGVVQFVQGGDATAEGSLSTALNQTSGRVENYTTAGLPAAGNAGRIVWDTTASTLKVDNGAAFIGSVTSPLTTKGDIWVYSSADVRLPVGSNGFGLRANSGQTTGLEWTPNLKTASIAITTSADPLVDVYICTATLTLNLPAAASNAGKRFKVYHNASDFTAITIDPNGAELIDGTSTFILYLAGEVLDFFCDGSAWFIIDHKHRTSPTTFTPGWTNLTLSDGTTNYAWWARDGIFMVGRVKITWGGGTSIGGSVSITVPGGLSIDTNFLADDATTGLASLIDSGVTNYQGVLIYASATTMALRAMDTSTTELRRLSISSSIPHSWASGDVIEIEFKIPISGWR